MAWLARLIVRLRYVVVAVYALIAVVCASFGAGVLAELKPGGFRDPTAESTIAAERARHFTSGDLVVIYRAISGTVDDVEGWAALVPALTRAEEDPSVEKVVSFFTTGAPWLLSKDRTSTVVLITLRGSDLEKVAASQRLLGVLSAEGFALTRGGYAPVFDAITSTVEHDLRRAELWAMPLTLLLLLLLFRSLISAALPVILGGVAVSITLAILRALDHVGEVTIYAANVATILGLGLAIDYALFVLMRYREELPRVGERRAVVRAMATAGTAVAFSGATVAVSLCGLFLFPHGMLRSVAVGGIAVTLATVVLATTLLPALLALLGHRIDALKIPFGLPLPDEDEAKALEHGVWPRIARLVMAQPVLVGAAVVLVLVACATPFARFSPSIADARALPRGMEARESFEAVEREFLPHLGTPHELLVTWPTAPLGGDDLTALLAYARRLASVPGVARVTSPEDAFPGEPSRAVSAMLATDEAGAALRGLFVQGDTARLAVLSSFAVDDERSLEQLDLLRSVAPPPGARVLVGGQSAWVADVRDALLRYTPRMVLFIAVAMLVVLLGLFRSVVLPLKAVAMNLLSLTASFGAIVWIFQDGRFTTLLQYEPLGTTESTVPVLMFAIVFGLSMDYEVLLLSRIREEYVATGDNTRAVERGLARTGRLITSGALLLVTVVLCFATSRLVLIKTLAVGISFAVLLDATIVRSLLVPATMRLLGRYNWWAPSFLRKLWE